VCVLRTPTRPRADAPPRQAQDAPYSAATSGNLLRRATTRMSTCGCRSRKAGRLLWMYSLHGAACACVLRLCEQVHVRRWATGHCLARACPALRPFARWCVHQQSTLSARRTACRASCPRGRSTET
jgi:hypothetical protein